MNIVEFVTKLASKFAPVDAGTVKTLEIQLTEKYKNTLETYHKKMEKNSKIEFEVDKMREQADAAMTSGDTEAAISIARQIEGLNKTKDKPSLVEKCFSFFNNPLVRVGLMIAFALVSAWIAKKMLGKKNDDDENDDQDNPLNQGAMPGYYPPPYYGYMPPQTGNDTRDNKF